MPFSFLTSGIFLWVYLINIVLSFIVIFFERKNPASTWAWLLVFIYLPVVGFCVYLIFGRNAKKDRMFMEKYNNDSRFLKEFLENNNRYSDEIFNQRKISENKDPILPKSIFVSPKSGATTVFVPPNPTGETGLTSIAIPIKVCCRRPISPFRRGLPPKCAA